MNKRYAVGAALLACCCAALAQQQGVAEAGSIEVRIGQQRVPSTPYVLAPQEFAAYRQPYLLETGMVLLFEQRGQRYYTRLPNQPPERIYPLAAGVFSSANGTLFVFRDDGDTLAVSQSQPLPIATATPARPLLARR